MGGGGGRGGEGRGDGGVDVSIKQSPVWLLSHSMSVMRAATPATTLLGLTGRNK